MIPLFFRLGAAPVPLSYRFVSPEKGALIPELCINLGNLIIISLWYRFRKVSGTDRVRKGRRHIDITCNLSLLQNTSQNVLKIGSVYTG
jgi:hypothetical protein